ncbi:MAG: YqgE/AlgH family protein [Tannerella sp.]|jgi:putative transcriptional regulator|nr:YqgE/AlgH family protein [Tannerella sp.]
MGDTFSEHNSLPPNAVTQFAIRHNGVLPAKGRILISEPFLQDAYFQRSVILLTDHTGQSSTGFVLNKKTNLLLNAFFDELSDIEPLPLFLGGPVATNRLFFIHTLGDILPDSLQISDNIYFDGDFESLNYYLLRGKPVKGKIKFFLGYSGWTKDQLADEIRRDSWLVGKADDEKILTAEGEDFWKLSIESIGGEYMTWINYPKNPTLN